MECKQRYLQLSELLLSLVISWCRNAVQCQRTLCVNVSLLYCSGCCISAGKGGSLASQLAAAETQAAAAAAAEGSKEKGKGKKPVKQMVLLSTSQRRYS